MSDLNNINQEANENNKIEIDSDSSQLSNFDERVKNDDIISSSSDDENNNEKENKENKENKPKDKDKFMSKSQEPLKLLGNKRALSKEHRDPNKILKI